MATRVLIPEVLPPQQPGDILHEFQAARERAYRRATDSLWPLRNPRGAVPTRGAYAMPESGLERDLQ